jgi:SAM-dependent methyltransferase
MLPCNERFPAARPASRTLLTAASGDDPLLDYLPRSPAMLREVRELWSYHRRSTERFARHDVRNVFHKAMRDLERAGFAGLQGKRVLDLGCGQRFSFALQCAAAGAEVKALDVDYVRPDPLPLAFQRMWRHNGLKRAAKSTLRRVLFDPQYYRSLESHSGRPLRDDRSTIDFVVADPTGTNYPLPAGSFDLIVSNAVLEHVRDVPRYAEEVARLLVQGGYFYGIIHNFYSLSGGHHMEWAFPDENPSKNVPPWDHLRDNRFPAWVYLNRQRPEDFQAAFRPHVEILSFHGVGIDHDAGQLEGEALLVPELAAKLAVYPRELLLTRSWCLVGRKG